eukprot:15257925-Alexandrium_andersonii.AAC.1
MFTALVASGCGVPDSAPKTFHLRLRIEWSHASVLRRDPDSAPMRFTCVSGSAVHIPRSPPDSARNPRFRGGLSARAALPR